VEGREKVQSVRGIRVQGELGETGITPKDHDQEINLIRRCIVGMWRKERPDGGVSKRTKLPVLVNRWRRKEGGEIKKADKRGAQSTNRELGK